MSQNEHRRTQADLTNDGTDAPRPENVHGLAGQQQGAAPQTPDITTADSRGHHGGNHGNDANDGPEGDLSVGTAKGSSHRGDMPNAESNNTGGGSDATHKTQTVNTTNDKSDYATGGAASSAANDGGKIDDVNNAS